MGRHTCCNKQKVKRGLWSPEEDEKLINYLTTYGHGCWRSVPSLAGLQRCGKSCRLRWMNYLRPDLKHGSFSPEEVALIIQLHRIIGNRWSQIAKHLPGRTDNEVKNFWNSNIKKKLLPQVVTSTAAVTTIPIASNISRGLHLKYYLPTTTFSNSLLSHGNHDDIGGSTNLFPSLDDSITSPNLFPNTINQCDQALFQGIDTPNNDLVVNQISHHTLLPSIPTFDNPTLSISSSSLGFQHMINNQMLNDDQHQFYVTQEQDYSCQQSSIYYAPHYDDDQVITRMNLRTMMMDVNPTMPILETISSFKGEFCNIPYSTASHDSDYISKSLLVSSSFIPNQHLLEYFNNYLDLGDYDHVNKIPSSLLSLPPSPPLVSSPSSSSLPNKNNTMFMKWQPSRSDEP